MADLGPLEAATCKDYVFPKLRAAGWSEEQIIEQYPVTDGRIIPGHKGHRREKPLRADYLLEYRPGLAVAVVEAKREYKLPSDGLQQSKRYAEMLDVPVAYSTNGKGIVEFDFDTGVETDPDEFSSPDATWDRYRRYKGIVPAAEDVLTLPFNRDLRRPDGAVKEPRYYQRVAIDRAHAAITAGDKRVLLTMATGTGKTFVALQIVWKLWKQAWPQGKKPRVLYLADRKVLVDQPMQREFKPVFGDATWKISHEPKTGREIYFALYQALSDSGDNLGIFRDYPEDYFDFVVVDECHRGSARDGSTWRGILDHFSPATQLGMTATPKWDDNIDTYAYFGDPLYTYSLREGIEDGFLAPYRVRRVVLSPDAYGWAPDEGQLDLFGKEIPPDLYTTQEFERVVSLLTRTEAAAHHLTDYLKKSDRMAKTIVFCVDQEHADQMRRALNKENEDLASQFPNYVARIVADEGDVGEELLGRFADPESEEPVIVTTSRLLSTGVDMPTVKNIVLFKPIGSIVDFKQIIGRGTRLYEESDKLSFEILDYSGATALFEDPEFDGPAERVAIEEIDESGDVQEEQVVAEPEPAFGDAGEVTEEEAAGEAREKFYVDDSPAYLVSEGYRILDPKTGKLKLVEYTDYVKEQVRKLFGWQGELLERWRTREGRTEIREKLKDRGVFLEEVAERSGLQDLDPLDALAHLAWNSPGTSRRDRARRLRNEHGDFLSEFQPHAREVLELLLEKYAEFGISQLEEPLDVLEVPPLRELGTPVEIAGRFGGGGELRSAVDQLAALLYAA
ncbi:MAG: DEAD/DEAH box helicase family protein [Actinomycetota bacterium]